MILEKPVASRYRSSKNLTHRALLYHDTRQIRPKMKVHFPKWPGAANSSFSSLDRVPMRFHFLVGDELLSTLKPFSPQYFRCSIALPWKVFRWTTLFRSTIMAFFLCVHVFVLLTMFNLNFLKQ